MFGDEAGGRHLVQHVARPVVALGGDPPGSGRRAGEARLVPVVLRRLAEGRGGPRDARIAVGVAHIAGRGGGLEYLAGFVERPGAQDAQRRPHAGRPAGLVEGRGAAPAVQRHSGQVLLHSSDRVPEGVVGEDPRADRGGRGHQQAEVVVGHPGGSLARSGWADRAEVGTVVDVGRGPAVGIGLGGDAVLCVVGHPLDCDGAPTEGAGVAEQVPGGVVGQDLHPAGRVLHVRQVRGSVVAVLQHAPFGQLLADEHVALVFVDVVRPSGGRRDRTGAGAGAIGHRPSEGAVGSACAAALHDGGHPTAGVVADCQEGGPVRVGDLVQPVAGMAVAPQLVEDVGHAGQQAGGGVGVGDASPGRGQQRPHATVQGGHGDDLRPLDVGGGDEDLAQLARLVGEAESLAVGVEIGDQLVAGHVEAGAVVARDSAGLRRAGQGGPRSGRCDPGVAPLGLGEDQALTVLAAHGGRGAGAVDGHGQVEHRAPARTEGARCRVARVVGARQDEVFADSCHLQVGHAGQQ